MIDWMQITGLGVIGEATVDLDPGFTVVTGETGAGKTMVVTALGLLLGRRADAGAVRRGSRRAAVDAGVRLPADHPALSLAVEAGAVLDDAGDGSADLVLSRSVTASGDGTRSRAGLGGRAVPVGVLAEVGSALVAVHGQNDQVRLQSAAAQRHALDAFGGPQLVAAAAAYRADHTAYVAARRERDLLVERQQERAREAEALQRGLEEIDRAEPEAGEDETLRALIRRLEDVEELRAAADGGHAHLAGPDIESGDDLPGAITLVESARAAVQAAPGDDPELAAAAGRLAEASVILGDIAADLARFSADLDGDAVSDLDAAQTRLAELSRLQRLYGPELTDVLAWAEAQRPRLEELQGDSGRIDELEADLARLDASRRERAAELTTLRTAAAGRLEQAVTAELHALFMPDASFHVSLVPLDDGDPGPHGAEDVALALRPHAGAEPRPLGRGASGGELSRVMLALEVVLAETDPVPTFVFDEVDAGVGGEAAVSIGARLARLARHVQVIAVTHLPQVAAYADRHVRVEKNSDPEAGVTTSDVVTLGQQERVDELARMLAGHGDSAAARAHARELLEASAAERA
ncbi:DNA repair protein RecN [Micrococcus porci]|uniref:DNA repair protein RecN n=1 Tax=Micrococcus porci TaxID=2856555 RepID=UPI001CCD7DB6|nr:DNA repair protein RecN [Micrococcus porci]UBH23648.1 DNA repair protein RecN [Micrococcus porci]